MRLRLFVAFFTLMLFGAHWAPAKATRPLVDVNKSINSLKLHMLRDLDQVTVNNRLGLEFEDSRTRERIRRQAREYGVYRKKGPGAIERAAFLKKCGKASEKGNPFCTIEAEIAAEKAVAVGAGGREKRRDTRRAVAADLRAGELTRLTTYSYSELTKGIASFDDFKILLPVANQVSEKKECSLRYLSAALASRAEEFFPEQAHINVSRSLYRNAADCGSDSNAVYAAFRYSLISIWANRCAEADPYLAKVATHPDASSLKARAKFWRYHCAGVQRQESLKKEMIESLRREHAMTFHNLVVNGKDPRFLAVLADTENPNVIFRSLLRPDLNPLLQGVEGLLETDSKRFAADLVDHIADRLTSAEPEFRLYVAGLMARAGNVLSKFRVLSPLLHEIPRMRSRTTLKLLFPKRYDEYLTAKAKRIDPLLILSLIRQESAFNAMAHSSAGARGLMQVMPSTARSFASVRRKKLFDPRTNIDVGTKYFLHRLKRYDGDVEFTLAAYNAGFTRVDRWIKRYPIENKILFMDLIPFRETREYVSSILRNYFWYTQLYGERPRTTPMTSMEKINAILSANAGSRSDVVPKIE